MKIAIIGTGIAGNVVAYHLNKRHDITIFEANDYIGGHTHTHDIHINDEHHKIDTGFIVFNHKTYPNFIQLLNKLGVDEQPSAMSFSVKCDKTGLEYNGTTLNSLFAQRRNLLNPKFYRMIRHILRFNQNAIELLNSDRNDLTLGEYLQKMDYDQTFIRNYIIPMGAAIWSADPKQMFDFPARFFVRFFHNHGMMSINERPQWYVIKNGSNQYVKQLISSFQEKIRCNTPVISIKRYPNQVAITTAKYGIEYFDCVFIASHSDQALAMLLDPSEEERQVLSLLPYQENEAVLHTDSSILPKKKLAWAAWNYHILQREQDRVALTYNMNILQNIQSQHTFCVTLNNTQAIDPKKIIKRLHYDHPVFTPDGVLAQHQQGAINGVMRTFYCGAYWRNGFHEDGVVSALDALRHFNQYEQDYAQSSLRRAS